MNIIFKLVIAIGICVGIYYLIKLLLGIGFFNLFVIGFITTSIVILTILLLHYKKGIL